MVILCRYRKAVIWLGFCSMCEYFLAVNFLVAHLHLIRRTCVTVIIKLILRARDLGCILEYNRPISLDYIIQIGFLFQCLKDCSTLPKLFWKLCVFHKFFVCLFESFDLFLFVWAHVFKTFVWYVFCITLVSFEKSVIL